LVRKKYAIRRSGFAALLVFTTLIKVKDAPIPLSAWPNAAYVPKMQRATIGITILALFVGSLCSSDAAVTRRPQAKPLDRCPLCNEGNMRPLEILLPQASALARSPIQIAALRCDTS
jgi:hypothetical protein